MGSNSLRRKEVGIAGALVILSQAINGVQTSKAADALTREIKEFKAEFQKSLVEREEFFVRKTDLTEITHKLDKLTEKINAITPPRASHDQASGPKDVTPAVFVDLGPDDDDWDNEDDQII